MDLDNYQLPDLQKEHVIILVAAVGLILSVYLQVPGFLYKDDQQRAVEIASNNDFMAEYRNQNGVENVSTSNLPASTVQELRENGDLPGDTSDNVYIVDYVNDQQMGVSAYVDVSKRRVVDTKYNYRIN